jgi:AcrR family transcriptional regulator
MPRTVITILPGKRLTERNVTAAKALLADVSLTSKAVAARFGVSKATLYRYLG